MYELGDVMGNIYYAAACLVDASQNPLGARIFNVNNKRIVDLLNGVHDEIYSKFMMFDTYTVDGLNVNRVELIVKLLIREFADSIKSIEEIGDDIVVELSTGRHVYLNIK